MREDILAGIVTRNPGIETLKRNLNAIAPQVSRVVIVDNGSDNVEEIQATAADNPRVRLIRNPENKGIACALNQIGDEAEREGAMLFLTLDQDSVADEGMAEKLAELFSDPRVGGASPYIDVGDLKPEERKDGSEEVRTAISSGFMVRTALWKEIGGFWEDLFIDEVDHEFCFQIHRKGYLILRRYDTEIHHTLGETFSRTVLGYTFTPNNHSAFRRYYIARNNIILAHLYPEEKGVFAHRYRMLFRMMVSIAVCEDRKAEKIKAILKGIRDGRSWNRTHSSIGQRRGTEVVHGA